MPRSLNLKKQEEKEKAIKQAISDYKAGKMPSIRAVADKYNIHYSTLSRRLKGKPPSQAHPESQILTPTQEEALVNLLLKFDSWGHPMKFADVRSFALHMQDPENCTEPGKIWISRFIKRHPVIQERLANRIDRQRASATAPEVLGESFRIVYIPP